MCCSLLPANFSNTIVYADICSDGQHLLGYQNDATNEAVGKVNGMLIPLPAKNSLGPQNMINTESCPAILKDMELSLKQDSYSYDYAVAGGPAGMRSFQAFKSGVYTVFLAQNATFLRLAMKKVPESERPEIPVEILEAYQAWYPNWQMALCTWQGSATVKTHPILWKFESLYPNSLFLPGLDAHDGRKPNLGVEVARNHTLIVGNRQGQTVDYQDILTPELDSALARKVTGELQVPNGINGDWWVDLAQLQESKGQAYFQLESPPGAC